MAKRLQAMAEKTVSEGEDPKGKRPYLRVIDPESGHWSGVVETIPENLLIPMKWTKPARVFVNSMSDLFHKDVPFEFVDKVFAVMALCPQHTFQVLTKRPERMAEYLASAGADGDLLGRAPFVYGDFYVQMRDTGPGAAARKRQWLSNWGRLTGNSGWPLPNVWLGTSVENQKAADERIPELLKCPAAVRFLSCEPLLGPVDFSRVPGFNKVGSAGVDVLRNFWVIVGGESGHGARACNIECLRSIVGQCKTAGVPVFVKQLGANVTSANDVGFEGDTPTSWPMDTNTTDLEQGWQGQLVRVHLHSKKGGDPSEWPEDLRVRQMPQTGGTS